MDTKNLEKVIFKKTKKSRLSVGIVMIILGLGLAAIGARIFIGYMTASKELTKCAPSEVDNGYYKFTDVWTVVDTFGYDNKGKGYVLWIINEDDYSKNFFMGMYFNDKDVPTAEKVSDAFWNAYENYVETDVYISGAGRVRDMRSDEKAAFKEAMQTLYGDNSYEDSVVYKTLEYKAFPRQMKVRDWMMIVFGLFIAVFGIWVIITMGGGSAKKKVLAQVAHSGMNPDQLASEITFGKKYGPLVITKNVIFRDGFTPILIFINDVVWCHGKITTTKNKAYGLVTVNTTKSYAVNFVDRKNKTTTIQVKNPAEQDAVITAVHEEAPYIICGYNEDIAAAAQCNFSDLINAVDHKKYELEHPEPKEQYIFDQKVENDAPLPDKIEFTPGSYSAEAEDAQKAQEAQKPLRYDDSSDSVDQYGNYGSLGGQTDNSSGSLGGQSGNYSDTLGGQTGNYSDTLGGQQSDYSDMIGGQSTLGGYNNSSSQTEGGSSLNIDIPGFDSPSSLGDVSDYTNTSDYTDGIL